MRLQSLSLVAFVAFCMTPARATVLQPAERQDSPRLETPILTTNVDEVHYDEKGRPVAPEMPETKQLRHSLLENLKIRLRRGYTISLETAEPLAIERKAVERPYSAYAQTPSTNNASGASSLEIDPAAGLRAMTQPLSTTVAPLWLAAVPTVTIASTGQTETAVVVIFGPSVDQNGFLATISANAVSGSLIPDPIAGSMNSSNSSSIAQTEPTATNSPLPDSDMSDTERQALLQAAEDLHANQRNKQPDVVTTAVPEPSAWLMMLIGFAGLASLATLSGKPTKMTAGEKFDCFAQNQP